jgi:hypothetical protein
MWTRWFQSRTSSKPGKNRTLFPLIILIGDTVRFLNEPLKLHNRLNSTIIFEQNYCALATLFVTRVDKVGIQSKRPNYKGKFGYCTEAPKKPFKDVLEDHLFETETIALPPFDPEDNCYFCAVDFDDHDGNSPQSENVKKLTAFLKERNLPCIVVKSGSNDGYHVFIPIVPVKTLLAYKFVRQLVKDAGLDDLKPELFPRQKSSNSSKGGYGTQIKLPLGFNRKAGKKSVVVDPYTLEPVEFVEVTRAVKLRDLPEPVEKKAPVEKKVFAEKKGPGKKKAMKGTNARYSTLSKCPIWQIRPCIRGVIDSKVQLDGDQGHALRVAIAAEALYCGMSLEETIDFFKIQRDFELLTTTSDTDAISYRINAARL